MVSREPEAVTICCSLVPENCPSIVCVIEEGGWIVREYMNMLDVAAILSASLQPEGYEFDCKAAASLKYLRTRKSAYGLWKENQWIESSREAEFLRTSSKLVSADLDFDRAEQG